MYKPYIPMVYKVFLYQSITFLALLLKSGSGILSKKSIFY